MWRSLEYGASSVMTCRGRRCSALCGVVLFLSPPPGVEHRADAACAHLFPVGFSRVGAALPFRLGLAGRRVRKILHDGVDVTTPIHPVSVLMWEIERVMEVGGAIKTVCDTR